MIKGKNHDSKVVLLWKKSSTCQWFRLLTVCCQRFTHQPNVFLRCETNAYFIGSVCAGSLSFFFSGCRPRFLRLAASPLDALSRTWLTDYKQVVFDDLDEDSDDNLQAHQSVDSGKRIIFFVSFKRYTDDFILLFEFFNSLSSSMQLYPWLGLVVAWCNCLLRKEKSDVNSTAISSND